MADKDLGDGDGPSLEMPSLGSLFKRKKKPVEQDDAPTVSREELDAVVRGKLPPEPADDAAESPAPASERAPHEDSSAETDSEPTTVVPEVEPEADTEATTVVSETDSEPTTVIPAADERADDAARSADDGPDTHQSSDEDGERPLFADEVEPDAGPAEGAPEADAAEHPAAERDHEAAVVEAADDLDEDEDEDEDEPRARRGFALPPLPGRIAAAITGLVVGLLAVALTYGAVQGCEKVKGTSSCGTPGFFLLIAIMILLVVLGSSLLGAWRIADPGSTSFMAVGLVAVVALLFLIRVIYSPWMIVVIPIVGVLAFVFSQWLTSLFTDEETVDESSDVST